MTATYAHPGDPARPLSPSQVLKYQDCPAAWHYKYVAQLPDPANANLAVGKAVHSAAAAALRAKMDGEQLPAAHVAEEILAPELEREIASAILSDDDDVERLGAQARGLYETWHRDALPLLKPAAVEKYVQGAIAGVAVRGYVDMIEEDGTVVDLKTASKAPIEISHSHGFQLSTYAKLLNSPQIRVDTITKTKVPKYIPHSHTMEEADRLHVIAIYPVVADAMAQGFVVPNRASLFCSRKNCAFWRACEDDYAGRVKA
jgi:RecB family exonuclease